MTAGTYSFAGKKATAPIKFDPVPAGVYTVVLRTTASEIRPPREPGKAARVSARVELPELLTTTGKPRLVFNDFNLSLKPGKDNLLNPERANGLLAVANAIGEELPDFSTIAVDDGDGGTFQALNAQEVMEWLKEHDGVEMKADIIAKKENTKLGFPAKNEIVAFMPLEGAPAWESGDGEGEQQEQQEEEEAKPAKKVATPAKKPLANGKKR